MNSRIVAILIIEKQPLFSIYGMYKFIVDDYFRELDVVLACMLKNFMAFAIVSILNHWKVYKILSPQPKGQE